MKERIERYLSVAALGRFARDSGATRHETQADRWYGYETAQTSLDRTQTGDAGLVPEAERLLAQIDAAIELEHREIIADRCGAYPIVPDFLQGIPDCMRRRAPVPSEAAPVAIWVCLTSSADVGADTLMRRGVAILALAMALSRNRPVDVHVFNIGRVGAVESVITAPLNTRPLDLAGACYALTSPGFARRVCYGLAQQIHWGSQHSSIKWPERYNSDKRAYFAGLIARMGGNPERDLLIEPAHIADAMLRNPVEWVNGQIARFRDMDMGVAA